VCGGDAALCQIILDKLLDIDVPDTELLVADGQCSDHSSTTTREKVKKINNNNNNAVYDIASSSSLLPAPPANSCRR